MTIRKPFFVVPYDPVSIIQQNTFVLGYPPSNLLAYKYIGLEYRTVVDDNIDVDFGQILPIDFMALLNTNAVAGASITHRLSNLSDFSALEYIYNRSDMIQPPSGSYNGRLHSHVEIPLTSARYIRTTIDTLPRPFNASHLVIGKKIEFDHFYDGGFGKGFEGFEAPAINAGGIPDLQRSAILRTLKFALTTMTKSDFHNKFQPLIYALRDHRPVYINFDPQADEYRQSNTYFGWLRKPAFATIGQTHPEWHSQELEILSQI